MPSFRNASNSNPVFTAGPNATFTVLTKEMMQKTQFEQWGQEQHPNQIKDLEIGDVVLFHSNPSAGGYHCIGKICAIDPYTNRIALDIIDREGTVSRMSIDATVVWEQERKRDAASIQEVVDAAIQSEKRIWYHDDLLVDQIKQNEDGKFVIPRQYGDPVVVNEYRFTSAGHLIASDDHRIFSNVDATAEFDKTMEKFKQAIAAKCVHEQKQYIWGSPSRLGETIEEIRDNLAKSSHRTSFYLGREINEATELMTIPGRWGKTPVLVGPDYIMASDIHEFYKKLAFAKDANIYNSYGTILGEWESSSWHKPLFGKAPETETEKLQSKIKDFEKKLGQLAKNPEELKMMLARTCFQCGLTPVFVNEFDEKNITLTDETRHGLCIKDANLIDMTSGGELHTRAGDGDSLFVKDLECIGIANGVFVAIGYNAAYAEESEHMWRLYSNIDFSQELQQIREAHMHNVLREWGLDIDMLLKDGQSIDIEEIGSGQEYTDPIIE